VSHFGRVEVSRRGEPFRAAYYSLGEGKVRQWAVSAGEYYRVCCPFCNDRRYRLYVNHMYGVRDPQTGYRNRHLAICFNENCLADPDNRRELKRYTIRYHRAAGMGRTMLAPAGSTRGVRRHEPCPGYDSSRPIPLPGDFVPLHCVDRRHEVRRYLEGRGFDPDSLGRAWGVGCSDAYGSHPLMFPVRAETCGEWVTWGWQARRIRDGAGIEVKYLTSKGLKKSRFLYGAEGVTTSGGPVLVVEGPVDVWRAGRDAVALLGKDASETQVRLLCRHMRGRPLVVALDGEAAGHAAELAARLRQARRESILWADPKSPVVILRLPAGRDPGDCTPDELFDLAARALSRG
jgi:hypothetical protein